jgi:coenzyme F420-reducing hydrogenase beta subunit
METKFQDVLKEAQEKWMAIDGVVAVGQGKKNQEDCIDVYIAINSDEIKKKIPTEYKNVPVVFRESGGPFVPQR